MKKFLNSKWFYRIIALVLTLMLFVFLNQDNFGIHGFDSETSKNDASTIVTHTLKVPLQLNMNNNQYFVTGQPSSVKVTVKGPESVVSNTTSTQFFKAYINLYPYSEGKHRVKVQYEGLGSGLHARIQPSTVDIDIKPRESKQFNLEAKFDKKQLASGYTGNATADEQNVSVVGAENEVNKVAKVIAEVDLTKQTKKNVDQTVAIEAVDDKGNPINSVIIIPSTTKVHITVKKG